MAPTPTPPAPAAPADVVRRMYAAFGAGDAPALLALAAPDSVWVVNAPKDHPYGGTFHGHAGFRQFLGAIAASNEMQAFGVDALHVAGDDVFVIGHETGRWRASGRAYTIRWLHHVRVAGGRVTRFEEWFDTATALAARARP